MNLDPDRVRARLLSMRELLDHLAGLDEVDAARLDRDFGVRLQVERVLTHVVTLATEINAHVAAATLRRPPKSLRASFTDLAAAGWIDRDLAEHLRDSAGLRNVLVHEYVEIDLSIVADSAADALHSYGTYVRAVATHLKDD